MIYICMHLPEPGIKNNLSPHTSMAAQTRWTDESEPGSISHQTGDQIQNLPNIRSLPLHA